MREQRGDVRVRRGTYTLTMGGGESHGELVNSMTLRINRSRWEWEELDEEHSYLGTGEVTRCGVRKEREWARRGFLGGDGVAKTSAYVARGLSASSLYMTKKVNENWSLSRPKKERTHRLRSS